MRTLLFLSFSIGLFVFHACAQSNIPAVYSNVKKTDEGYVFIDHEGNQYPEIIATPQYTLEQFRSGITGTKEGLSFDFNNNELNGTLYFGLINNEDASYPQPVFFKKTAEIIDGKTEIKIANWLSGKYDMVGWQEKGYGKMGYRIVRSDGQFLYDGKCFFAADSKNSSGEFSENFQVVNGPIEGPFVNQVGPNSAIISFITHEPQADLMINNKTFNSKDTKQHEILVDELKANTQYNYTIKCGEITETYSFKTAPEKGSREAFTFAYASDSRAGQGGGERNIYGTNAYIMKKIFATAKHKNASFIQFTGDLINGYLSNSEEMDLQYANWKRAVEPFWHSMPCYANMGNHEALSRVFDDGSKYGITIDRFPFETESAEAIFARNFTNPLNGPESEDGHKLDPNSRLTDFPSYKENAFHYTYGNIAMIVLNSDYWYSPSLYGNNMQSGNLHAYIMENQLNWLEESITLFEQDEEIDHIFVTQHTPAFPNGGHVGDDMWYNGNNEPRPLINGKKVEKGIIERRDEYLDILINKSDKVRAILTGDEHNYNRLYVNDDMPRYPENYKPRKQKLERGIWQINNGAAGAPYYAQQKAPWSKDLIGFTTQNALVLIEINGEKVTARVINPDTLELFDSFELN